jgi:hypothetical protein
MLRNRIILTLFSMLFLLVPLARADEIHLKDGNVLRVEKYEEKEDQIIFNLEGGRQLYSMDKSLVKEIRGSGSKPKNFEKASR